ncbi:MAG: branched-chain amino acid transaminase [Actinomycetota bacterium]|nr:branched-chain amino acid transaminase [Actinomycetota bacterium]
MEPTKNIWFDGEMVPWADANVHVLSHALHYGTGIFEGIRAYETPDGTAVFRLTDHMVRLHQSAKAYHMKLEWSVEELVEAAKETLRVNGLEAGYVRPISFLELGAVGLNPSGAQVRTAIITWRWGAYLGEDGVKNGIRVKTSSWRRFPNSSFPNAKATGTYINSILAKMEAVQNGYDEALMLNQDGVISEGSGENLFLVRDGVVYTPPIAVGCLDGLTRNAVSTLLAEEGHEIVEKNLDRTDLYYGDEVFFTGTAAEVTPVREVDDRAVGDGTPGPITRQAQGLYADLVTGKLDRHQDWLEFI